MLRYIILCAAVILFNLGLTNSTYAVGYANQAQIKSAEHIWNSENYDPGDRPIWESYAHKTTREKFWVMETTSPYDFQSRIKRERLATPRIPQDKGTPGLSK